MSDKSSDFPHTNTRHDLATSTVHSTQRSTTEPPDQHEAANESALTGGNNVPLVDVQQKGPNHTTTAGPPSEAMAQEDTPETVTPDAARRRENDPIRTRIRTVTRREPAKATPETQASNGMNPIVIILILGVIGVGVWWYLKHGKHAVGHHEEKKEERKE